MAAYHNGQFTRCGRPDNEELVSSLATMVIRIEMQPGKSSKTKIIRQMGRDLGGPGSGGVGYFLVSGKNRDDEACKDYNSVRPAD